MKWKVSILIFVFTIISCSRSIKTNEDLKVKEVNQPEGKSIVICDISDEALKKIKRFQPLADYLAENLNEFGITVGEVKVARNVDELSTMFMNGDVDIYMDSPFPAMLIEGKTGAEPLLKRWKNGVEKYHTVFITDKNSDINNITQLRGKILALEDPYSTSGYMLPLGYLTLEGYSFEQVSLGMDSPVNDENIGWLFAGEDQNIVQWVLSGDVDGGVLGSSNFDELPAETMSQLNIIAQTPEVPRQLVLLRKDMDQNLKNKISELLIDMENNEKGREVLFHIKETSKFEGLSDVEGKDTIEYINSLYNSL